MEDECEVKDYFFCKCYWSSCRNSKCKFYSFVNENKKYENMKEDVRMIKNSDELDQESQKY